MVRRGAYDDYMGSDTPEQRLPVSAVLFFAALLAVSFFDTIAGMVSEWRHDDDMSHGFLVPLVAGYIAWQTRSKWLAVAPDPSRWGWVLIVWGCLQLLAGTLGAEMFISRTALLISITGVLVSLGGWQVLRELAFPLFLLLFMIRIPNIIYNQITFPLQLFASEVAEQALHLIEIPVFREGNILHLAKTDLSVVEACSGIRSLLSLSFMSLVYAYLSDPKPWMRVALLILTVPIAVAANAFRVTITGILSNYDPALAEGVFHSAEGYVIFLIAFACLFLAHRLVNAAYGIVARPAA